MYYHFILIPVSVVLIILYALARKKNDLKRVAIIQPVGTFISILIAGFGLLTPDANTGFTLWILAGLILAFVGDINNVDMADDRTVIVGLVIFVLAYLTYPIGLTIYNGFHKPDLIVAAVLLCAYVGFLVYVWDGLKEWRIPVMIYALIMPFMVNRAVSTFFGSTFSTTQAVLLTCGTLMLYLGDMEYGIHRFRKPIPMHFGPYFYAGGQLLIALSPSCFRLP